MGNLALSTSLFRTDATTSEPDNSGKFVARRICSGIIYYYTPMTTAEHQTVTLAKDSQATLTLLPASSPVSLETPSHTAASNSRPLLLFFSWLGAQPGAVAKYRDLYLDRGMDVLLIQSSVMHFLWPRWGLSYGLEILNILEEPPFTGRPILVHASSIGGYTFTQLLTHIAQHPKRHAPLAHRVIGHIYDSLVVGSLDHMATGLGKTLVPRLEGFVKTTAMLYFRLFKSYTADLYENSIQVFHNSPVTSPALFFSSENDAMCSTTVLEKLMDLWRRRGVSVDGRKWKKSTHAAHLRCHPEEYVSTLQQFLNSLPVPSHKSNI
ncbi:PREDICTED: uncharacterized protein LOC106926648 [Poecilia mexicana]|uniref:Uncharacterized protein n=1 Tax=Poecilia mexicana TaxID=48701 RepID=A0A3B3XLK6_9TELE|nr:PREDICTED: uncharacterized protein LOC106918888 [Poecilia mexicana]XP_014857179.1 PREDICTED: uncharacterized protein LOC106926648 [Poecilia mexicana]